MLDAQDLGRTLKELRGRRSRREVSERGWLGPATWSAYERRSRLPRPERFQQIAKGLGVSVVELQYVILESANRRAADATIREISRKIMRAVPSGSAGEGSAEVDLFSDERLAAVSREIRDLLS